MPYRSWVLIVALGLLIWEPAYSQQPPEPQEENQPERGGHDQESQPATHQDAEPELNEPTHFLPAIKGIEAAIRDLIAEQRRHASQDPSENEVRDLISQEAMAWWAELMFYVALASVIITAVGVVLVWKTLSETAKATNLLGQDFIAANPPVIKVFQAHLDFEAILNGSGPVFGGVYTVNTGGSEAKFMGIGNSNPQTYGNIILFAGAHPPDRKPFEFSPHANPLEMEGGL